MLLFNVEIPEWGSSSIVIGKSLRENMGVKKQTHQDT